MAANPAGHQAEKDYEGDFPSDAGSGPVCGNDNVNKGASSSLSGHVYPNPPVLRFKLR